MTQAYVEHLRRRNRKRISLKIEGALRRMRALQVSARGKADRFGQKLSAETARPECAEFNPLTRKLNGWLMDYWKASKEQT